MCQEAELQMLMLKEAGRSPAILLQTSSKVLWLQFWCKLLQKFFDCPLLTMHIFAPLLLLVKFQKELKTTKQNHKILMSTPINLFIDLFIVCLLLALTEALYNQTIPKYSKLFWSTRKCLKSSKISGWQLVLSEGTLGSGHATIPNHSKAFQSVLKSFKVFSWALVISDTHTGHAAIYNFLPQISNISKFFEVF